MVSRGGLVRLGTAAPVGRGRRPSGRDLLLLHELSVRLGTQRGSGATAEAGEEVLPAPVAVVDRLPQETSVLATVAGLSHAHSERPLGSHMVRDDSIPKVSAVQPGP
jgi:hypothetical protein